MTMTNVVDSCMRHRSSALCLPLHLAIFDDQCIALASIVAKDPGGVEGEIHRFSELSSGISQEANLPQVS